MENIKFVYINDNNDNNNCFKKQELSGIRIVGL